MMSRTIFTRMLVMAAMPLLLLQGMVDGSGDTWKVGTISFSGNKAFSKADLKLIMRTRQDRFWRGAAYSVSGVRADMETIRDYYREHGYLNAVVKNDSVRFDSSGRRVHIVITISEGAQTTIGSVGFEGAPFALVARLREQAAIKPGVPYGENAVSAGARAIESYLASRGYLQAAAGERAEIDSAGHRAGIIYTVSSGPLFLCGPISVKGLSKVKPLAVTRELVITKGDTLTSTEIGLSIKRLYGTGLFNYIQIEPLSEGDSGVALGVVTAPTSVIIEEGKFFTIDASVGYGTYDHLRGGFQARYTNFFGLGHALGLGGNASRFMQKADVTYTFPDIFLTQLHADLSMYVENHTFPYQGLFDGLLFAVSRETERNLAYRIWAKLERTESIQQDSTAAIALRSTQSIGAELIYNSRALRSDTSQGVSFQVLPELAGLGGHGTNQYFRTLVDCGVHLNGPISLVFSSAINVGYAKGYGAQGDKVPPQALYYIGAEGMMPVRGYTQNEIDSSGGRLAVVANLLEIGFPIYKIIGGTLFSDCGFSWAEPADFKIDEMRLVAGPGIRVKTPIGTVRLDWGYRLNHGKKWGSPSFNFGTTF